MIQKTLLMLAGSVCAVLALFTAPVFANTWQCTKGTECRVNIEGKEGEKKPQELRDNGLVVKCERFTAGSTQLKRRPKDLQFPKPEFTKCSTVVAGVKHAVTVEQKECEIRFTLVKQNKEKEAEEAQGTITIKPKACQFTIKVAGSSCLITIRGEQGPLEKFRAKQVLNEKTKLREVQIQTEASGILATNKGCGVAESGKGVFLGRARIFSRTAGVGVKIR